MIFGSKLSLLRNIGWMGASTGLRLASGMLSFVIVARLLGPEHFGVYMFWMSVAGLLTLLVNFGFTPLVLREIGANPDSAKALMSEVLTARLLLGGILLSASALAAILWLDALQAMLLFSLLFALLADAMTDLFNVGFRATNRFALETRIATATSLLQLLLVAACTWFWPRLEVAALAFLGSRLLVLALTWLYQRKYFSGIGLVPLKQGLVLMRRSVSYAIDFGAQASLIQTDVILLGYLAGSSAVGVYQAAMRLAHGLSQAISVVVNVFLPKLSVAHVEKRFTRQLSLGTYGAFCFIGVSVSVPLWIFSDEIAHLFYGDAFVGVGEVIRIISVFVAIRFIGAAAGIQLIARGEQVFRSAIMLCAIVLQVVVMWLLVPKYGANGAATAMVGVYLFIAASMGVIGLVKSEEVKLRGA